MNIDQVESSDQHFVMISKTIKIVKELMQNPEIPSFFIFINF